MENDVTNLLNGEDKKQAIDDIVEKLKKPKKGKGSGKPLFKPGNKAGVKFGQGQPTDKGGRPKGPKTVVGEMRSALERLGLGIDEVAKVTLDVVLSKEVDPQYKIAFIKEINTRVFGQPKSSVEESLKQLQSQVDLLCELTIPLLEATAIGDGVGIVRELMKQGKLDDVVQKVRGETDGE